MSAEDVLADTAYTLQVGRSHFPYRKAVVCNTKEDARSKIKALKDFESIEPLSSKGRKKIVFMFPGQGAQYNRMCYDLYRQEEVFRSTADTCFRIVNGINGMDLKEVLFSDALSAVDKIDETRPILVAEMTSIKVSKDEIASTYLDLTAKAVFVNLRWVAAVASGVIIGIKKYKYFLYET